MLIGLIMDTLFSLKGFLTEELPTPRDKIFMLQAFSNITALFIQLWTDKYLVLFVVKNIDHRPLNCSSLIYEYRKTLSVQNGLTLWGNCVVAPPLTGHQ